MVRSGRRGICILRKSNERGIMTLAKRIAAACALAAAAVIPGAATAQPSLTLQNFSKDGLLKAYLAVIDDSCPAYRVALAFPKDEHGKLKIAIKAEASGAYAAALKEFETNIKVAGPAGACSVAIRKAQENGANTTNLVGAKEFFAQQEVAMMETAQLRFADGYCKRLTVDWQAENVRLEQFGLDPNARRVKGVVKKQTSDIRSRHRREPAPYCLELYNKWSSAGLLKTKE
jgi:hypothetical protein